MSFLYVYEEEFTSPLKHIFFNTSRRSFSSARLLFTEGTGKEDVQRAVGCNCWDSVRAPCYFDALKVVGV